MSEPGPELRELVASAVGARVRYRSCGWPWGVSDVWEVSVQGEARWFLKRHAIAYKFHRERRFYEQWAPHLPDMTPELVAVFPDALLIAALPGESMETATLPPEQERSVYRQAGRFLRALESVPYAEEQAVSLADELAERMHGWLAHARDYVAADDIRWVADRFRPHDAFAGTARVPTHGDFQPRNWMVDTSSGRARLGVFDFEHTRGDPWFLSIVKLWDRPWVGRPDIEAAFWEGYGRALEEREQEQLRQTLLLHVIGVIVWSRKHGDTVYEGHGRRLLERLRRWSRS